MNIRDEILITRKRRILKEGFAQGLTLPKTRVFPVVPFGENPFVICEIKRKSPSKGDIAPELNPVELAGHYRESGVAVVSILTEQDHFGGGLADLAAVKRAYPDLSILRKDFLFAPEDVEVSFLLGADAVLLIASMLGTEELRSLLEKAEELGLSALVEVHTKDDVRKAEKIKPKFTGINSRDLRTFAMDKLLPIALSHHIGWDTKLVYESGIAREEDAVLALSSGFSGLLVGEAAVKDRGLPARLAACVSQAAGPGLIKPVRFWKELTRRKTEGRPLVKICGLTTKEDVRLAEALGADILGFVFAPSPRRAVPSFVAGLGPTRALKAGVAALREDESSLPKDIDELLRSGGIDVIQYHGEEKPEACYALGFPYYKAAAIGSGENAARVSDYFCPRVLIDSPKTMGGGISPELVRLAEEKIQGGLWMAGGIGPDNVAQIIREYKPELIDAASRLERAPGEKDSGRLKHFFTEIDHGYR